MQKLFKWPGSKKKELKKIVQLLPSEFNKIVEPFAGSAALSFHLEKSAIILDADWQVINFYKCFQKNWQQLYSLIENERKMPFMLSDDPCRSSTKTLEDAYYNARERLNAKKYDELDFQSASDFYITRCLAFSGMLRTSSKGNNNVPYGWYQSFKNVLSSKHDDLMKEWRIECGDYKQVLKHVAEDDFVFLDPPYRNRAGYQVKNWGDEEHAEFIEWMKNLKQKWLLIHTIDEMYLDELKDFRIETFSHSYSQNFKGRNNSNSKVEHIYVMNF
jgi:DNA adenine methylase